MKANYRMIEWSSFALTGWMSWIVSRLTERIFRCIIHVICYYIITLDDLHADPSPLFSSSCCWIFIDLHLCCNLVPALFATNSFTPSRAVHSAWNCEWVTQERGKWSRKYRSKGNPDDLHFTQHDRRGFQGFINYRWLALLLSDKYIQATIMDSSNFDTPSTSTSTSTSTSPLVTQQQQQQQHQAASRKLWSGVGRVMWMNWYIDRECRLTALYNIHSHILLLLSSNEQGGILFFRPLCRK